MQNAAVVGMGWWGRHIIQQVRGSTALRVLAAVGRRPEHKGVADEYGLAFTTDLRDVLADRAIDLVILATPHGGHVEQIEAVAASGKHVFCEKPLALDVKGARRAVDACRTAGVRLGVGHERRFEPAMAVVRELLANGVLGRVMHIEANFSHDKLRDLSNDNWRLPSRAEPPLAMTATGIHLTDAFIDLLGPITEVAAFSASRVAFPSSGDVLSSHVKFASGATGYFNTILVTPFYARLVIFGSDAHVEVRNDTHPDQPGKSILTIDYRDGRRDVRELDWTDPVRANLESFASSIEGKAQYPFTDDQLISNIAVLEAITRATAGMHATAKVGEQ